MLNSLRPSAGFTLIELMIVVAIIGILAALALPAYQDYTGRAQFIDGLGTAAGLKADLLAYVGQNGACPVNAAGNAGNIRPASSYATKVLARVDTKAGSDANDCVIEGTFKNTGIHAKLRGKTLSLTAVKMLLASAGQYSMVDFVCSSTADASVRPSSCQ